VNPQRIQDALFAARLRPRGVILSSEAIADVCEVLLYLVEEGTLTLSAHEHILKQALAAQYERITGAGPDVPCPHGVPLRYCARLECHMRTGP
jgi:hypothetical protein